MWSFTNSLISNVTLVSLGSGFFLNVNVAYKSSHIVEEPLTPPCTVTTA